MNLLTKQVEFANVIVFNKTDLVNEHHLGELQAILQQLNPNARIVLALLALFGKVDLTNILHTGLFNFGEAEQGQGWQEGLKEAHHTPKTEEYGIGSFVFRSSRPFHPQRFRDYIFDGWPGEVIRSKGLFWLASRHSDTLNWGQADGSLRTESASTW